MRWWEWPRLMAIGFAQTKGSAPRRVGTELVTGGKRFAGLYLRRDARRPPETWKRWCFQTCRAARRSRKGRRGTRGRCNQMLVAYFGERAWAPMMIEFGRRDARCRGDYSVGGQISRSSNQAPGDPAGPHPRARRGVAAQPPGSCQKRSGGDPAPRTPQWPPPPIPRFRAVTPAPVASGGESSADRRAHRKSRRCSATTVSNSAHGSRPRLKGRRR